MKVIIVGGGACGASCATRLRRLDESCEITILERTNEVSTANCGLHIIAQMLSTTEIEF